MNNTEQKVRPKVSVIYPYIAHYRRPIFESMSSSNEIEYEFWADTKATSYFPDLKLMDPTFSSADSVVYDRWTLLKNHWFLDLFLWQSGLVSRVWNGDSDAYIFLADMFYISTWVATIVARIKGKDVYHWTHGCRRKESGVRGILRRLFYRLSTGLFLYGTRAKKLLEQQGMKTHRMHVIYNSLDFPKHNEVFSKLSSADIDVTKRSLGFSSETRMIVAAGRLTKDKKFDMILEVILDITRRLDYEVGVVIVGDGPEKESLEKLVKTKSLIGKVVLYGPCYDENILGRILYSANVATIPGNIGLFGMHSLSFGTPVVTHNNFETQKPEFEAIISGVSGSFYENGNPTSFADELSNWLEFSGDRALLRSVCRSVIIESYNPEAQLKVMNRAIINGCH